ncbi:MAG: ribbon-helix-helix protein, CopG family [Thermomicrobiales bacterium]|nr:ribbon-helix-helix protein, CopG family [Thermomicrobiales bacterium]MCO5223356.1 ribbon-helix-helix domain-containing protein [Thermomicrobiales bacterium]
MADATLIVPEDLKTEIEAVSKREHRSEADVIRDALRQYVAHSADIDWPQSIGMASEGAFNAAADEAYIKERWMLDPNVPQSIGVASGGRIQSDEVDEWLEKNWERDW